MFYFVFVLGCAVCEDSAPLLLGISGGIGRRTQYQSEFSENLYASNVGRIMKADISSRFEPGLVHELLI